MLSTSGQFLGFFAAQEASSTGNGTEEKGSTSSAATETMRESTGKNVKESQ
ncbi:MAG: hypothetical protein ABI618_07125 [Nitrospirota bacterium]